MDACSAFPHSSRSSIASLFVLALTTQKSPFRLPTEVEGHELRVAPIRSFSRPLWLPAASTERSNNLWGRQTSIRSAAGHKNRYQAQLESIDGKLLKSGRNLDRRSTTPGFRASEGPVKRRILSAGRWREIQEGQRLEVKHAALTSDELYR